MRRGRKLEVQYYILLCVTTQSTGSRSFWSSAIFITQISTSSEAETSEPDSSRLPKPHWYGTELFRSSAEATILLLRSSVLADMVVPFLKPEMKYTKSFDLSGIVLFHVV